MNIRSITFPDINNGLGCRVTLWTSGCNHHCKGCHNQCTWGFNEGRPFNDAEKEKLFSILSLPYIKGLTLSGGDPIDNYADVLPLAKEAKAKFPDKDIWLYTGYTVEQLREMGRDEIIDYVDYIVDGEFVISKRDITLAFRGSSNQRIWHRTEGGELEDMTDTLD